MGYYVSINKSVS